MAMTQPPQPVAIMPQPQPQPTGLPPVQYMEYTQPNPSTHPRQKNIKAIFGFGIVEVVLGSICLILGSAAAGISSNLINEYPYEYPYYYSYCQSVAWSSYMSHGIWSGVFLIVTGILGIILRKKFTRGMYSANMAMAIITANVTIAGLVVSASAAIATAPCDGALYGLNVVIAILCFATFVITILHASFCCAGVCNADDGSNTQTMIYMPQQGGGYQQPQIVQGQLLPAPATPVAQQQQQPPTLYKQTPVSSTQQMHGGVDQKKAPL